MLIGEYNPSIDLKGRLHFPARLREDLGDKFIVTKGLDNCLFVYSLSEWAELEAKIKALPISRSCSVSSLPVRWKWNWISRDASSFPPTCGNMPIWTRMSP